MGLGCSNFEISADAGHTDGGVGQQQAAVQGANLGGANLGGANLGGANLGGANLGGANLGGANLGGANLGGANLGGANMGGNNLGGLNMAATNLGGANLGGANLGGSSLGGSNVAGTNLGQNLGSTNLNGASLASSDSGSRIHSPTTPSTSLLYSGEDQLSPKSAQRIVLGIGSTAFARFLGENSPNARISVALGKLPWGFASSSGGPVTLEAWEAVVWGDQSYNDFVLVAPPGTDWAGVAGFIKAVFRWNAPATQFMDISGIEASASHDPTVSFGVAAYSGMANAAAQFRSGKVRERDFVAGELAFITATTNNQAVKVDFSAWVMDSGPTGSKAGLILANVDSVNKPNRAEAVYYAYDNSDGTVGIGAYFADATPAAGITDSIRDLATAYDTWSAAKTTKQKPIPLRCTGALYLEKYVAEPVPAGKCDEGLTWISNGGPALQSYWRDSRSAAGPVTTPFNSYQVLPYDANSPLIRSDPAGIYKKILAETYIHNWYPVYELNRGTNAVASATGSSCTASQTAVKAFDNFNASSNGTQWCAQTAPSVTNPLSLMATPLAAYAINAYTLTSGSDAAADPREWKFQGCSSCTLGSDAGWVDLDTRKGQVFADRWRTNTYYIGNSTSYSKYRLRITANNGSSARTQVAEVQLMTMTQGSTCSPLSDTALCASIGRNCGAVTTTDNCGASRTLTSCGTCSAAESCGGGGVAGVCY